MRKHNKSFEYNKKNLQSISLSPKNVNQDIFKKLSFKLKFFFRVFGNLQ